MHCSRVVLVAMALVVAGACQTPGLQPAALPDDTQVVEPGSEVPREYAAFSGVWSGTWGAGLDGTIAVRRIEPDGTAEVVYAWGDDPQGRFTAGSTVVDARIRDGVLMLERFDTGALARFRLREDGRLDASYEVDGEVTEGVFTRQ